MSGVGGLWRLTFLIARGRNPDRYGIGRNTIPSDNRNGKGGGLNDLIGDFSYSIVPKQLFIIIIAMSEYSCLCLTCPIWRKYKLGIQIILAIFYNFGYASTFNYLISQMKC